MGFMAKFKCDKKPVKELEAEITDLFGNLGLNTVYVLKGDPTVGFYNFPENRGAINTIFMKKGSLRYAGENYKAVIGVGDMDETLEAFNAWKRILSGLMYDYDN